MNRPIVKGVAALLLACLLMLAVGAPTLSPQVVPVLLPEEPAPEEPVAQKPPPAPEPEPEPEPWELTLVVTGDLMAHWDQVEDAYIPEEDRYDFSHCFAPVARDLQEGYAIGNLETVFGGPEIGYSSYPQFSTPDAYGWALKEAGFDFVSTCNNHSLDKYGPGVLRTLEQLEEMGLAHTGTYASQADSQKITLVEAQGLRIAVLAYTFSTNGIPIPQESPWMVNMLEEERLIADLAKAKALEPDLIVVMPHMGNEYETYTRDVFLAWMDLMLYHGADMVFASHPHVLQKMLVRDLTDADGAERQGFIICSLGNFISCQRDEPRDISILLKVKLSQELGERPVLEEIRFVPTWVTYWDSEGNVNIRVVPVADALASIDDPNNPLMIRHRDADRLRRANSEITALYLGAPVLPEMLRREYIFYQREPAAT